MTKDSIPWQDWKTWDEKKGEKAMIKKKRTVFLFLCTLLACGFAYPTYGARVSDDAVRSAADYFWGEEQDEDENEYSNWGTEDSNNGPGITAAVSVVEESPEGTGPKIHDVTMGEKYHQEFGLYEQSLNNQYFLYSNVENGGITDQPVYVDIPADLIFTMEKDGIAIPYFSKQKVGDKGTYVLRITAIYDKNVPLSEQEEYRTVFRFRIDEKAPVTSVADRSATSDLLDNYGFTGWQETSGGTDEVQNEAMLEEDVLTGSNGETAGIEEESESLAEEPETEESEGETEPESIGEAEEIKNADKADAESAVSKTQTYDKDRNAYTVVFSNGVAFISNVPENMITSLAVQLMREEGADCSLYQGEEEIPWETEMKLTEFGQYRVVSGNEEFGFEITNTYVNRDEFTAPVGTEIMEAKFQDETMRLVNSHSCVMKEDGKYTFSLIGEGEERYNIVLNRDTTAPEFTVNVESQRVAITYLSDDMSAITLQKRGEEPKAFASTIITEPGHYVLTVTDRAGNETSQEFTLRYRLNTYAMVAILMIVSGIAGGAVFLMRKKRNLGVR